MNDLFADYLKLKTFEIFFILFVSVNHLSILFLHIEYLYK